MSAAAAGRENRGDAQPGDHPQAARRKRLSGRRRFQRAAWFEGHVGSVRHAGLQAGYRVMSL